MRRMILRRALTGLVTIACIYLLTFVMVVSLPGNPFQQGQHNVSPEIEAALRARYNMDNNWLYFWQFLRGAIQLDFGPTCVARQCPHNHNLRCGLWPRSGLGW